MEDDFGKLSFDVIKQTIHRKSWSVEVNLPELGREADVKCKVDTGTAGNVLPLRTL